MKFTPRQAEVMADLAGVESDGSRHAPLYRLRERNVSIQVRSLLAAGVVELQEGRLIPVERASVIPKPATFDVEAAVSEMRNLLAGEDKPSLEK